MASSPRVSVIVTTYNRAEFLKECIQSLLAQTLQDFELLVIDNFSNYDAEALVNSFQDKRIRFFRNQNNGRIGANRNFGIQKATGAYLAFCDDDDVWVPEKLEKELNDFDETKHIAIGTSWWYFGDVAHYRKKYVQNDDDRGVEELMLLGPPAFSSLLMKNEGLLFSTDIEFQDIEDFEFLTRRVAETKKKVRVMGAPLVGIRIHTVKNEFFRRDKTFNSLNVIDRYKDNVSVSVYHQSRARQFMLYGFVALRLGSPDAVDLFRKAIQEGAGMILFRSYLGYICSVLPSPIKKILLTLYFQLARLRG